MTRPLDRVLHAVTDWAWPRACYLCGLRICDDRPLCLCGECEPKLVVEQSATCPRCASTVGPHTDTSAGCAKCRNSTFRFTGVTRLGEYDGPLREAVLKAKQLEGGGLAESLGRLFAMARGVQLRATDSDVIVPVPLHWRRLWERRHNQAEGIARGLSSVLRLPVRSRAVWRVKASDSHRGGASRERRWANTRGAFRLAPWGRLPGVRVLLVDDVLTTGATADAVADALRRGGAAQVHVAVLAHR